MNLEQLIFGATFIVALGSAIAMLFAPNAVHVALFLVGTQVALAVAFLLEGAFFIAALQIIIYAGAIMVLFLFVVMLLNAPREDARAVALTAAMGPTGRRVGAVLSVVLAAQIVWALSQVGLAVFQEDVADSVSSVRNIGRSLFTDHAFAFEVTSVLILVAMVGAVVLARKER